MLIRFQIHQNDKAYNRAVCRLSKRLYRRDNIYLSLADIACFLPFILGLCLFLLELDKWEIWDELQYGKLGWGLLVYAVGLELYVTLLRPAWVSRIIRNKNSEVVYTTMTLELKNEGLFCTTPIAESLYFYQQIKSVENIDAYLFIVINRALFLAVPHTAFADDADRSAFENVLHEKISAVQAANRIVILE